MDKNFSDEQKITDRGWRDMKMRLDRELPVAKSSRRPLVGWFWFSTVLVGLLTVGSWLFFTKNGIEKSPVQPVETSQPVAIKEEKSVDPATTHIAENKFVAPNPATENRTRQLNKQSEKPVSENEATAMARRENEVQKLKELREVATNAILKNPFSEKTAANFSEKPEVASEPVAALLSVELKEKPAVRNPKSEIQNLNPLSEKSVSAQLFGVENRPTNFSKTTIPFKNKAASHARFGAFSGLQTIDFQRLNGFSVGLVVEKISRSGRKRLSVGFGWNRVIHANQPNLETDNSALFEQNFYVTETEDSLLLFADILAPMTSVPANGYSSVVVSANIYNRLTMPVSVSQKLGSRWHIGLGLTPSWLVSARSQLGGELFHFEKSTGEALHLASVDLIGTGYSLQSVNSLLNSNLPRFDLAASASVQVDLTQKWRLGLEFQRGLVNQTALPDVKKFHRSTNLKLVRWF